MLSPGRKKQGGGGGKAVYLSIFSELILISPNATQGLYQAHDETTLAEPPFIKPGHPSFVSHDHARLGVCPPLNTIDTVSHDNLLSKNLMERCSRDQLTEFRDKVGEHGLVFLDQTRPLEAEAHRCEPNAGVCLDLLFSGQKATYWRLGSEPVRFVTFVSR